jgi:hypothetical protein
MFTMSFDPSSLATIAQMSGWSAFLTDSLSIYMVKIGDLLVEEAQENTWKAFADPTGDLADSIQSFLVPPWEVEIGVGVPYGRRREYGFSGMTDSLGRYYANDPAKPYLRPALEASQGKIAEMLDAAVLETWNKIGGNG